MPRTPTRSSVSMLGRPSGRSPLWPRARRGALESPTPPWASSRNARPGGTLDAVAAREARA
eukprot:11210150-Lingulodinium_polyedra.AAC.1